MLRPPPLGIVALRAGKCVATGDDGKRYCDDPRPTRRGLADPEKSVVTKAKIRHFVTHQPMLLVPIEAPAAVSAVIPSALSALLRENVGRVSIKASYEDKTTARDNGLAASGRCSSAILVSLTLISMRNAGRSTMRVRLVDCQFDSDRIGHMPG